MNVEAVVIGAGQAGLALSRSLQARGIEHVVFERGLIGETWRSQRWDSFALNTQWWMNALPDEAPGQNDPDSFGTALDLVATFGRYAAGHDLPIVERCPVERVVPRDEGFAVDAGGQRHLARSVVLAHGAQNVPRWPAFAGALAGAESIHASGYRSPSDLPEGPVLVVGSAQSGSQIAEDLLDAGRRVFLATSRAGRLPRRHRGRDSTAWWLDMGLWSLRPEDLPDPGMMRLPQPNISGTKGGHSLGIHLLGNHGAILLGGLVDVEGTRLTFADDLPIHLSFESEAVTTFRSGMDEYIERAGIEADPFETEEADIPFAPTATPTALDVTEDGIGTVIWATGFTADYSWLEVPGITLDDRGLVSHVDGVLPVPGLFVLGIPWLTKRNSGVLLGAGEDAALIADRVLARSRSR